MAQATDEDRRKAKEALGELGEVKGAVEAVARLLVSEREAYAQQERMRRTARRRS